VNPLDYSVWEISPKLVYEEHGELYANLHELKNVKTKMERNPSPKYKKSLCSEKGV